MPRFPCMLLVLLLPVCLVGCSGKRNIAPDPVAQSGVSSEDIWYPDGGARWAWTAIPRPRHLYTGLTGVRDPALYQVPQPQRASVGKKSGPAAKAPSPPSRPPECPPCPPVETAKRAPAVSDAGTAASPPPSPSPQVPVAAPPPQSAPLP